MSSSFVTPWTVACQAPLSLEFSRQEYWSGLPFPSPGDLLYPRTELLSLVFPVSAGNFFTTKPPRKADTMHNLVYQGYLSVRDDCLSGMKCAHSTGNPHQTPGRQRKNHLHSMSLLQTNLDVTV